MKIKEYLSVRESKRNKSELCFFMYDISSKGLYCYYKGLTIVSGSSAQSSNYLFACNFNTFFTIFCSSTRNARTILVGGAGDLNDDRSRHPMKIARATQEKRANDSIGWRSEFNGNRSRHQIESFAHFYWVARAIIIGGRERLSLKIARATH